MAVRRSMAVKLTLLPMLASAAVAAQPATEDEPPLQPPGATAPMLSPPGLTPTIDECSADPEDPRCPTIDECSADPEDPRCPPVDECSADLDDPSCPPIDDESPVAGYGGYAHGVFVGHIHGRHHHHHYHQHGVFRGGFGHYFWAAGG
jgi:hypothetical protein